MYQIILLMHVGVAVFSLGSMSAFVAKNYLHKDTKTVYSASIYSFVGTVISGLSLLLVGATAGQVCPALITYTLFSGVFFGYSRHILARENN